jgi:general secretion pathway protein B
VQPAASAAAAPHPPVVAQPTPAPASVPAYVPPQVVQPPPPPAVARTPPPPAPPTPPVKGLPPDAPKLVVNGGTYSERRDMRLAIVNGNVVREGASVDGVVVERIEPEGLVLAFRGSRYHVAY